MREQDEEAQRGADGDDGALAAAVAVVARVPLEVRVGADGGEGAGDAEAEPEQEVAGDVDGWVDRSVAAQEDEDVGRVPQGGEAEGDEFPGEEGDVLAVGPGVVVGVVEGVVGGVCEGGLVGEGPADEGDAGYREDDSEGAEDVLPEECGVVGVHLLAGGTHGE